MPRTNFSEISTYLKHLKFDPKLYGTRIASYLTNLRLVILLVLAITVGGIFSYINLPRSLTPDVKIPYVFITTVLPGAGPADVESLITVPIEDSIQSLQGIKNVQSTSTDSFSVVTIEFEAGVDSDEARTDVQTQVSGITDFPQDAQTPNIEKLDFESGTPVWTFDVVGKGDSASLFRFSNDLKEDIENLPSVDRVEISGFEEQEIQILISPQQVSTLGLNPQQVIGAITTSINALPAGNVRAQNLNLSVSIDPAVLTVDDIRNLKLNILGQSLLISDIAEVAEKSKPDQTTSFVRSGEGEVYKAVSFNIFRVTTSNIEKTVEDAREVVNERISNSGDEFQIFSITDFGELIGEQFGELQRDFVLTIILVVAILFVFLGARQAIVSALTAPITFFITFMVMRVIGIGLNFISVFSLLLSLGLLVDDTIVIISATTAYHRARKFTPLQTGLLVFRDFLIPVLTTTTTTVWAFLPILITSGIIGEFIKPVPIVASTTLIASIFTALFIAFPLVLFLLKPEVPFRVKVLLRVLAIGAVLGGFAVLMPKNALLPLLILAFAIFLILSYSIRRSLTEAILKHKNIKIIAQYLKLEFVRYLDDGIISFSKLSFFYKKIMIRILLSRSARIKTIVVVVIFSFFSYMLLPLGLVKNEFFPLEDQESIFISVELPPGTNVAATTEEAKNLLPQLGTLPDVEFIVVDVGRAFSQFGESGGGNNNVLFSVHLKDKRGRTSLQIAEIARRQFANYTRGKLLVEEAASGPPAGADLTIKLFGQDLQILDQNAEKINGYLSGQGSVVNVDKTVKPGASKLVFTPDKQKMIDNGLTQDQIGFWLRLYLSGLKADDIELKEEQVMTTREINIRLNDETATVESLGSLNILTPTGGLLPLSYLGTIRLEQSPTLITREDFKRTISVTGDVLAGFSVTGENQKLEKFADSLELPLGYSWETGGVNEENQRSVQSILQAMIISFLLIVVTMVLQFNSFRRALIVMLVIPLSIAGVFIVFGLTNTPLSFPALIGVLALFGIVVKNSILVVDKIVVNIKTGMSYVESIADGASSRLEPIALTSMAAIFGLIPITLSSPLWRGLGGAIISGLAFSGTVMLLFIPVVYFFLFRSENKTVRVNKGNRK